MTNLGENSGGKIIVSLMGGLGNQMFQYAFFRELQARGGGNAYVDISWFEKNHAHNGFELEKLFPVKLRIATAEDCEYFLKIRTISARIKRSLVYRLNIRLTKMGIHPLWYDEQCYYTTEGLWAIRYTPKVYDFQEAYLSMYFQSEKYFSHVKTEIRREFTPKNEPDDNVKRYEKAIREGNSVSIHVRRGDYLKFYSAWSVCTLDYYRRALEIIKEKVNNPHFFIFSDDLDWCRENIQPLLLGSEGTYVTGNTGEKSYWDMYLISCCKHNIMANSSFS